MSLPRSVLHASSRASVAMPVIASFALLLGTGLVPASAQQRVESATRRAPRAEPGDSTERQVRRLQRQLDSLTRAFTESDGFSYAERRRLEDALSRTVRGLVDLSNRLDDASDRAPRSDDMIRFRVSPMGDGMTSPMAKAISRARELQLGMPTGWIGIVTEGPATTQRFDGGEYIVRYLSYPRIVSVDPSSPAQRAGLAPGDTLLAYNGLDVRENEISLTRLLRPSAKVNVRVEREGRVRELPVIVAAAPTSVLLRRDEEGRSPRESWEIGGVPEAPGFPWAPLPPSPSLGALRVLPRVREPGPAAVAGVGPSPMLGFYNGVAGAELTTITDGLARTIGVRRGVLVTRAPAGGIAYESGLQDGDVIQRVAGQEVRSVADVRSQVKLAAETGGHVVELRILREKKPMTVLLRW